MPVRHHTIIDLAPTNVICEPSTWTLPDRRTGVFMRLSGPYRHGSAGRDDAKVIFLRINEACELASAVALIVDARDLEYQWGDNLDLEPRDSSIWRYVVIRPGQWSAFAPIVGERILRTDLDATFDESERRALGGPANVPAERPPQLAKSYLWTEVWFNNGMVLLLRAATDGTFDLCFVGEKDVPYKSFATLDDAQKRLRSSEYQLVEGRRES